VSVTKYACFSSSFLKQIQIDIFIEKVPEAEQAAEDGTKNRIKLPGAGNVACRLCKGNHYTAKCPYKDTLGNLENNGTI
jgi:hypothetical protein